MGKKGKSLNNIITEFTLYYSKKQGGEYMNRKAQGATEYLIILGVVIIIALIVVAAMGGIPGIGTGAKQRASASFWQTADIAVPSYAVTTAGDSINMTLRNNLRNSVTLTAMSIGGVSFTVASDCDQASLSAGQTTECEKGTAGICTSAGDSYTMAVSVTYTDDETEASYTYTGEGHKLEGKCAT